MRLLPHGERLTKVRVDRGHPTHFMASSHRVFPSQFLHLSFMSTRNSFGWNAQDASVLLEPQKLF